MESNLHYFSEKLDLLLSSICSISSYMDLYKSKPNIIDIENSSISRGCRHTAYHLFATFINPYDYTNTHFPNTDIIVNYISLYSDIDKNPQILPNCLCQTNTVSIFTLFRDSYYRTYHTFIIINVNDRYKILQSWHEGSRAKSRSIHELSSPNWLTENPIHKLFSFLHNPNINDWTFLFRDSTLYQPQYIHYSCKCIESPIHSTWFNKLTDAEKKIDRPTRAAAI